MFRRCFFFLRRVGAARGIYGAVEAILGELSLNAGASDGLFIQVPGRQIKLPTSAYYKGIFYI